jgi:phosphoglycerate dehydrogenase-like enzyme
VRAGAGEQLIFSGLQDDRLVVTSAAGVHAVPLAEFALFGLLALNKQVMRLVRASERREWLPRWPTRTLNGSRIAVVGLGGVGREVARLASAFGAEVVGCRRTGTSPRPPGVTQLVQLEEMDRVLPSLDAVIISLPGSPATNGWLNGPRIALLPPHAVVVNVGRGSVVDSSALAAALDRGALRGAALDVTDTEPLPADSRLWSRDDVILSPHTAALTTTEDERILTLFCDNLQRLLTGQPLTNVVDPSAGY